MRNEYLSTLPRGEVILNQKVAEEILSATKEFKGKLNLTLPAIKREGEEEIVKRIIEQLKKIESKTRGVI